MATARTPSTAGGSASRLAATVAREIELLAARRERLRHRQNDLCARLRDLDDELSDLECGQQPIGAEPDFNGEHTLEVRKECTARGEKQQGARHLC